MKLECYLIEMFRWSLREIDETDIESLIPFVFYYPQWKDKTSSRQGARMAYADEVNWL